MSNFWLWKRGNARGEENKRSLVESNEERKMWGEHHTALCYIEELEKEEKSKYYGKQKIVP
jgi:hypothetical protein